MLTQTRSFQERLPSHPKFVPRAHSNMPCAYEAWVFRNLVYSIWFWCRSQAMIATFSCTRTSLQSILFIISQSTFTFILLSNLLYAHLNYDNEHGRKRLEVEDDNDMLIEMVLDKTIFGPRKSRLKRQHSRYLRLWNGKKVFRGYDSIFHVFMIIGLKKYQRKQIPIVTFWG